MGTDRRASRLPGKTAGALAAALPLAAAAVCLTGSAALAGTGGNPAAPRQTTVTSGPARSLGEPAAARNAAVSAVTATSFGAAGPQAAVWTERAGATAWQRAGAILPAGFGTSYDPAAAAVPGGPLLLVAGTAPGGQDCIAGGSVAITSVDAQGKLSSARLVSDQRGSGYFDDRPMVAVGQHGTVWVAWSQGPDANACQDVGTGDRIEVAVSHDGGQTFGSPVAMPAKGGHSAFGVRLAPLADGQVAVSWTETMGHGDQAVLVSVLSAGGQPGTPSIALDGDGPPLALPDASFYDFPAGDIAALPDGRLVVAAPYWEAGHSVLKIASGTPGGQWLATTVNPPSGADLLLPALGTLSPTSVQLLCAVHDRTGDRLGYDDATLTVPGQVSGMSLTGLTPLTSAPPGPGFYEIGEELALTPAPGGLFTAVVVAGRDGATLQAAAFTAPQAPVASPSATPATASPASGAASSPATGTGSAPRTPGASAAARGFLSSYAVKAAGLGGLALLCCAVVIAVLLARRRRARAPSHRQARPSDWPASDWPPEPPGWRSGPPGPPGWQPGPPDWRSGPPGRSAGPGRPRPPGPRDHV